MGQKVEVRTVLSIRRKPGLVAIPGDDTTNYMFKVGSALKGIKPNSGLSRQEEEEYLPSVINVQPKDTQWLKSVEDYWSNISAYVPADEEVDREDLKGKVLKFTVEFNTTDNIAEKYKLANLEEKAKIISQFGKVVEGISDYILYRYCLVYGRVANNIEYIGRSAKIRFYLYSKDEKELLEVNLFKLKTKATRVFLDIMEDEKVIDSLLRMFNENPNSFDSLGLKHLKIEEYKNNAPNLFMSYVNDKDLVLKANIKKAVNLGIIYNPKNTDAYYYGADNDVLLGNSMTDAVLFFKSENSKNREVAESIKAQLKGK